MANLNDVKLSAQDILKKQFRSKVKGYDPDEVDAYLDQVISDYETFHQIIGTLQRQLMDAKKQSTKAATETEEVKTYTPTKRRKPVFNTEDENQGEISTNMAIIQRISTLERKVYNLEQHVYGLQK